MASSGFAPGNGENAHRIQGAFGCYVPLIAGPSCAFLLLLVILPIAALAPVLPEVPVVVSVSSAAHSGSS